MSISRFNDFVYSMRLVYLLQQNWKDTDAFKSGVINDKGEVITQKSELTPEQKSTYTHFHRIAFNLKRLIAVLPGGDSKLARLAAGLRLLKESNKDLERPFNEVELSSLYNKISSIVMNEETPTNVTGAAVSTNIEKPLPKKSVVRRKEDETKTE